MTLLLIAAVIYISMPKDTVPDSMIFSFKDQAGNIYNSKNIIEDFGLQSETGLEPMILFIETPDFDNPDFKKQYEEIMELEQTNSHIIPVISCPQKEHTEEFFVERSTADIIFNKKNVFRIMLINSSGKVIKHWTKAKDSEVLTNIFMKTNIIKPEYSEKDSPPEVQKNEEPLVSITKQQVILPSNQ